MSEEPIVPASPPPPPPPAAPPPPPSRSQGDAPPKQQSFSPEYVHELREENKDVRLKKQEVEAQKLQLAEQLAQLKKDHEAALKAIKDEAKATETAAKAAADQRIIHVELKAEAAKLGVVDFGDMLKIADISSIKVDDEGEVVGAVEMLTKLKEAKPYLFGDAKGTSSTSKAPPAQGGAPVKSAKDMTPAEYATKLAEIRRKST